MLAGELIRRLSEKHPIGQDTVATLLGQMLRNEPTAEEVLDLLQIWQKRGYTVSEVVAAVLAIRTLRRDVFNAPDAVDLCGTGGNRFLERPQTTAYAFVVAAGGVHVLKFGGQGSRNTHGNGRGSTDFIEALSGNIDGDPLITSQELKEAHFGYAAAHRYLCLPHSVSVARKRFASSSRRYISILNLVLPFCSPAEKLQLKVIGVPDYNIAGMLAQVARRMIRFDVAARFAIVTGVVPRRGLTPAFIDDISSVGPTAAWLVDNEGIKKMRLFPQLVGLSYDVFDNLLGGSAENNCRTFLTLISGGNSAHLEPLCNWLAMNAGFVFWQVGQVANLRDGFEFARSLIEDGSVLRTVEVYQRRQRLNKVAV